jgi:putative ABC transport system substrate-binding protein
LPFTPQPRVAHIGWLWTGSPSSDYLVSAVREGLREAGWVEGQNLVFESRAYGGDPERIADVAAELVASKPDVLGTGTTAQALALTRASDSIPIVFGGAYDPVGSGLIASYARPGGHVTGASTSAGPPLGAKRLDLLRQLVPGLARVAVVFEADDPPEVNDFRDIQAAAQLIGIDVQAVGLASPDERDRALDAALARQLQALIIVGGGVFPPEHRLAIVDFAKQHGLATASTVGSLQTSGVLLLFGPDMAALYHRAANYHLDRILRGANPADLPVEGPTVFDLTINRTTARSLGVTVPPQLAAQVTEWVD